MTEPKMGLFYCPVLKAGSTTLMVMMAKALGVKQEDIDEMLEAQNLQGHVLKSFTTTPDKGKICKTFLSLINLRNSDEK